MKKDIHKIHLTVNKQKHELAVETRRTLADILHHDLGYTNTHLGCEHSIYKTYTILVDGAPIQTYLVFKIQTNKTEIHTIKKLAGKKQLSNLQQTFNNHHTLQYNFYTPKFLILTKTYLTKTTKTSLKKNKTHKLVAANLYRCTGYQNIVEAVVATTQTQQKPASP